MNDKTSDKRYRITLTENQLALVGTAVEGMMNDLISRKALCDYALNQKDKSVTPNDIMRFPSAAYTKAVWTWLLDYQIKAAKLKGRYTPYEVLSWVANDWRKEHEGSD